VGFFAEGKLKKVFLGGGAPIALCDARGGRGASWGADGMIIFPASFDTPLSRISAAGGIPQPFTTLDANEGESSHRWPEILPGGSGVIFTIATSGMRSFDDARIAVQSLHSPERRALIQGGSSARYSPTGHLVFARGGTILAVPFDLEQMQVKGTPVPVIEDVRTRPGIGAASFAFSRR
jgi:serine/threonine-protein kinase